jgi:hypothetical protein
VMVCAEGIGRFWEMHSREAASHASASSLVSNDGRTERPSYVTRPCHLSPRFAAKLFFPQYARDLIGESPAFGGQPTYPIASIRWINFSDNEIHAGDVLFAPL